MKRIKNILVLIDSSRLSGPGRQVIQIFHFIDHRKYHHRLGYPVVGDDETELLKEVRARSLPLSVLPQRCSFDPRPLWWLPKILRQHKIDVMQTHGYKPCFLGFWMKLWKRTSWIHFMHGHTNENWKVACYFWLEFQLARYADRIVTVSEEMERRLVKRGLPQQKTVTIQNALDPQVFRAVTERVTREQLGVSADDLLLGVIGRFSPEKGVDIFLDALRRVVERHPQVKAILIGEGPMEGNLRQQVESYGLQSQVLFAGYQPQISSFYPLLDLLVLPSRSEGLPNVALEALFFRVPVVATAVGGTPEVIVDDETGLLVPSEDPLAMAAAIEQILVDESLRQRLISGGEERIKNHFLPEARVQKIESLYMELLGA